MPPKDDVNAIDGTLYFMDTKTSEYKPLCKTSEISEVEITEDMDAEVLGDGWFQFANNVLSTDDNCEDLVSGLFSMHPKYHFGFDLDKFTYKMLVRSHPNNYRRLHGLRPVRHKVWRHNPYAAKRMGKLLRRGGFKFK